MLKDMIQKSMQKEASLLSLLPEAALATGHFALHGALIHAGQNVLSDLALKYEPFTKRLLQTHFQAGLQHSQPTVVRQLQNSLQSGFTPEVGLLAKELNHAGSHLEHGLNKVGLSFNNLSDNQHAFIQAAAKGDIGLLKSLKDAHPEETSIVHNMFMNTNLPALKPIQDMLGSLGAVNERTKALADGYKKTSFSKFLPKVLERPSEPVKISQRNVGMVGDVLTNAGIWKADPLTATSNIMKKVVTSKALATKFPLIGKAQKAMSELSINNPAKKLLNTSTNTPGMVQNAVRKYLQNPVVGDVMNMSQTAGSVNVKGKDVSKLLQ